ncbi:hypothetical protein QMA67_11210 [Gluconobacter japonicus]|uniref:DDE-type integrase/transposase/recombinase n=1 Tax=Gluconobacter japonicus TaxID=376620 RepID=UPI0024AD4B71|nr:DDE-type integrase/transposase/recombinase [Gluconobacter japonicus]MDI6653501.1 hypothetical protein [Gluconobacter japonicus]
MVHIRTIYAQSRRSYGRKVIGWNLEVRITADLATTALQYAIALRQPPPSCIHHADRGSQYCSEVYRKLLSAVIMR